MCSGFWRGAASAVAALIFVLIASLPSGARAVVYDPANQWLPTSEGATWTYEWTDASYSPTPTKEKYTIDSAKASAFTLAWTTKDQGNSDGSVDSQGQMAFNRSEAGLINTDWASTAPPSQFPILCAQASGCGNSLASSLYMVIWGTRGPVLQEPLLGGSSWGATGGASGDVQSDNRYVGRAKVTVPAFPDGVMASKVESDVTQAGALGDPYGSGTRTIWWVYGVGPVKVEFQHTGGGLQEAHLVSTNLFPKAAPSDVNYLPLNRGETFKLSYRNSRWMKKRSIQRFTVSQVVNNTARVDVKQVSGPIKVAGSYAFATRLSGVTNVAALVRAASLAKFPKLGPKGAAASRRRHFFTPLDLMTYGFNPVLTAYPRSGDSWNRGKSGRDYRVFGVTGFTKLLGMRTVKTPAGTFRALAAESRLSQPGFPYGSGVRVSYFAPGKGLVKLVFRHRDHSVSTVERVR